jgi:putative FmdB family regulatory protein
MPIYDFQCRTCGKEFEALVRPQDAAAPACPSCQGSDLEKLLSGFAVSSSESRAASALGSRKRQINANKDKIVADEEYRKEHEGH